MGTKVAGVNFDPARTVVSGLLPAGAPRSDWRKSSYSAQNGCCVEVATGAGLVDVRDSKNPRGPVLQFAPAAWSAFLIGVKTGEFDA